MRKEILILAILSALILTIISVSFASAAVNEVNNVKYGIIEANGTLTTTATSITNANLLGFVCSTADCSTVSGNLFAPINISTSSTTIVYPTILQGTGYGLFFFKEGYIPYEVKVNYAGSGNAPAANDYLTRKRICSSAIPTLEVTNSSGNITVTAFANSPISNGGPLNYLPSTLNNIYSASVDLQITVTGAQNLAFTKTLDIPYSGQASRTVSFAASPGTYTINATTTTSDLQCLSSTPVSKTATITIQSPPVITCSQNTDCGTNGFVGTEFCSNNNIAKNFRSFTCNNPGTPSSFCSNSTSSQTVFTCASNQLCSNAQCITITCSNNTQCNDNNPGTTDVCVNPGTINSTCTHTQIPITCSTNSDCGQDRLLGSPFCSNKNVVQDKLSFTCNLPGTTLSSCSNSTSQVLQNSCMDYCLNGQCKNFVCKTNTDCNDNNATTTDICNLPGTINSTCSHIPIIPITCSNNTQCDDGNSSTTDICVNPGTTNSTCTHNPIPITCRANSDCGTNGFVGTEFCSNNNIAKNFRTFTCNLPGTTLSSCSNSTAPQIVQACQTGFTCNNGACIQNPPVLFDLSISDGFTEPSPLFTNSTDPAIRFHNNNTGNQSLNVPVAISIDGNAITTFPTLPFNPGYNLWGLAGIPALFTNGTHTLRIVVDPNNTIQESNENNNVFVFVYQVLTPPQPITCSQNIDCGQDRLIGDLFCSNNSTVSQNKLSFTCNLPGTALSFCSNSTAPQLVNTCQTGFNCNSGVCVNQTNQTTCTIDSQCDDNNTLTFDQCINPGAQNSFCRNTPINCATNTDCGSTGFIGDPFCSTNASLVFKNFQNSTCANPGTPLSFCVRDVSPNPFQTCSAGATCSSGSCVQNNQTNQSNPLYGLTIQRPLEGEIFNYDSGLPLEFIINGSATSCFYNLDDGNNVSIPGCSNTDFDSSSGDHTITLFASNSTVTVSGSRSFSIEISNNNNTDGGNGGSTGSSGSSRTYIAQSNYVPKQVTSENNTIQDTKITLNTNKQPKNGFLSSNWFIILGAILLFVLIIIVIVLFVVAGKK